MGRIGTEGAVSLDRERERYRSIFEAAGVAIWELDYGPVVRFVQRLRRLGISDVRSTLRSRPRLMERLFRLIRIGDVNEEVLRLTGAPDKDAARILGPRAFARLHDGFVEAVAAVAEGRREVLANDVIRTLRGDERKVAITLRIPEDVATVRRVLFCAHDVTELESAQRRYELAISGGGVAVFEYRIAADELVIDSHLKPGLGLPPGIIRGADMRARIHPADAEVTLARYADAARDDAPRDADGNTPIPEYEIRMIGGDGSDRWFLKRGVLIRDAFGRPDRLIGTMTDITDRKLMEEAVRVSQDRLRDLAGRLIAAQEEERLRIARDLDDDLNQRLAAISATLRMLRFDVADQPAPIRTEIRRLELEIEQIRNEVMGLSDAMGTSIPDGPDFVSSIRALCIEFGRIEGLDVSLEIGSSFASIARPISSCLYRVAQEALRNAARHSGSRTASIVLDMKDACVVMQIRDFGCGFDVPVLDGRSGLGLISMRERVRLAGGELSIASSRGSGTVVNISIPLSGD